jgi:hypothetical protein
VDLTITKTAHGKTAKPESEVIHTNKKHPFLTVEKGFLPVGQMKLGMHVVEADGRVGVITGWKIVPGVKVMYNLEVQQDHTYAVGVGQWVVHNCDPYDVVPYRPSSAPLENHHGILDKWAAENIPGYESRASDNPTIALTSVDHAATKAVYRAWLFERTGRAVGGVVDWQQVSAREIYDLSERMFDAANVPQEARETYYQAFNRYIYRGR